MEFFTFSVPKNPVSRGNLENFPTKGHIPFRNPCLGEAPRTPVVPLAIATVPFSSIAIASLSLCVTWQKPNLKIVYDDFDVIF